MNVLQVPKVIGVRCDTVVSQIINRIQAGPAQAGPHHCSAKSDLLNFVTHNWKKRGEKLEIQKLVLGKNRGHGALCEKIYIFKEIWGLCVHFIVFEKYKWETRVTLKLHLIAGIYCVGRDLVM